VYSTTLTTVGSARTRIEHHFESEEVARMKVRAERDITSAVPTLPPTPSKAGLVDEYHLIIAPWVVGGGKQSLPTGCACGSSCWMNAASATAWRTFVTA